MELITTYVNKQGQKVIQKWERIKAQKPASWLSVMYHAVKAMILVSLAIVFVFIVWLVKQVQVGFAWLAWKVAQLRCWAWMKIYAMRTGKSGTGRGRGYE